MTAGARPFGPVEFPDGVDGAPYLRGLRHSAWSEDEWTVGGAAYRRRVTRDSPLRFALTYLGDYLLPEDGAPISFSLAHLDMCAAAERWPDGGPQRAAWVLPRGGGKSVWLYLILPLWALAHGHRRYFLSFALTADQAEGHLENLRAELDPRDGNALLLADFPELGKGTTNRADKVVLAGGATFAAKGLTGSSLGRRQRSVRPDLIIGDDIEPDSAVHNPERKAQIQRRLTDSILPMGGPDTVVHIAGTTTMVGSLMHDVVRAALPPDDRAHRVEPWIAAHGFVPCYWPAILDEDGPAEQSMWPQRWSLAWLKALRDQDPHTYALNYRNRPEQAGDRGWWHVELIRYNRALEVVRRVLSVDPAMSNNRTSDKTAVVLLGQDVSGHRVSVEYAAAQRGWHGEDLRLHLWRLAEAHPETLHELVVETQHGGDRWEDILAPLPPGVRFIRAEGVSGRSKKSRLEELLKVYQRKAITHREPLQALEDQQLAWTPAADKDDLLDALANGVRHLGLRVPSA